MKYLWFTPLALMLGLLLSTANSQEKKPNKAATTFTDVKEAGPDYAIQGEYAINDGDKKAGAQIIARGDGNFEATLYKGGLPGAGWDGKTKLTGKGKTDGSKTVFTGEKEWTGEIANGEMTVTIEGKSGTLKRVVRESPTLGMKPPAKAIVLFDGTNTNEWNNGEIVEGNLLRNNDVSTKRKFKDMQLHLEFRLCYMPYANGQARSNSGVYLQSRYELQVLDSFGLKGVNNECGGFYTLLDPSPNMCLPPLQWQTYDIDFQAAKFDGDKKVKNAVVTVKHNGVTIHDAKELVKLTPGRYGKDDDTPGELFLQHHGNKVYYKNIWVVEK